MFPLVQVSFTDEKSWPLLGMAALALAYVVIRPMLRRRKDPMERSPVASSMAQQRAVEREMSRLLVDLTEMARQISAQLDTRAAKLEALLREADEKIDQLRGVGASESSSRATALPGSAGYGTTECGIGEQSAVSTTRRLEIHDCEPRHADVYALADEGRSPAEIAARLNRPNGEIELILALRPRAKSA